MQINAQVRHACCLAAYLRELGSSLIVNSRAVPISILVDRIKFLIFQIENKHHFFSNKKNHLNYYLFIHYI